MFWGMWTFASRIWSHLQCRWSAAGITLLDTSQFTGGLQNVYAEKQYDSSCWHHALKFLLNINIGGHNFCALLATLIQGCRLVHERFRVDYDQDAVDDAQNMRLDNNTNPLHVQINKQSNTFLLKVMQAAESQKYVQHGLWDDEYNLLLLSLNDGITGTGIYVTFRGIQNTLVTLQSIIDCMQEGNSEANSAIIYYGAASGSSGHFVTLLHDELGGRWVFYDSIGMYLMYKSSVQELENQLKQDRRDGILNGLKQRFLHAFKLPNFGPDRVTVCRAAVNNLLATVYENMAFFDIHELWPQTPHVPDGQEQLPWGKGNEFMNIVMQRHPGDDEYKD